MASPDQSIVVGLRARGIMGRNFLGPSEVQEQFRVRFTNRDLVKLADVPFAPDELESSKDTHILVAGYPLSISDVRKRARGLFCKQGSWYNRMAFARKSKPEVCWYLIRKTAAHDSFFKTWAEQQGTLTGRDVIPQACVMVYTIILHYLVTGERLFVNTRVRCNDGVSAGRMVTVGCFGASGLDIYDLWESGRYNRLGLAAART